MKSFYEILEVPQSATTDQIRSAYLKLVREYHPDRVPEHLIKLRADAEEKFKLIQQAWAILGDPAKRNRYDEVGRNRAETPPTAYRPNPAQNTHSSQAGPVGRSETARDFLQGKQQAVKWSLLVIIITLVLIVIGEVIVSRQSAATPADVSEESRSSIVVPVPADIRKFNLPSRHIVTWSAAGNTGLEVELLGVAARPSELELTFRAIAGRRGASLLYEPPGASGRAKHILEKDVVVDGEFAELHLEDASGAKYNSTTGFVGGLQTNFNLYNFTRRISLKPHEEVVLLAKFPPLSRNSASITFVSPALGKWQPEWRWPEIALK